MVHHVFASDTCPDSVNSPHSPAPDLALQTSPWISVEVGRPCSEDTSRNRDEAPGAKVSDQVASGSVRQHKQAAVGPISGDLEDLDAHGIVGDLQTTGAQSIAGQAAEDLQEVDAKEAADCDLPRLRAQSDEAPDIGSLHCGDVLLHELQSTATSLLLGLSVVMLAIFSTFGLKHLILVLAPTLFEDHECIIGAAVFLYSALAISWVGPLTFGQWLAGGLLAPSLAFLSWALSFALLGGYMRAYFLSSDLLTLPVLGLFMGMHAVSCTCALATKELVEHLSSACDAPPEVDVQKADAERPDPRSGLDAGTHGSSAQCTEHRPADALEPQEAKRNRFAVCLSAAGDLSCTIYSKLVMFSWFGYSCCKFWMIVATTLIVLPAILVLMPSGWRIIAATAAPFAIKALTASTLQNQVQSCYKGKSDDAFMFGICGSELLIEFASKQAALHHGTVSQMMLVLVLQGFSELLLKASDDHIRYLKSYVKQRVSGMKAYWRAEEADYAPMPHDGETFDTPEREERYQLAKMAVARRMQNCAEYLAIGGALVGRWNHFKSRDVAAHRIGVEELCAAYVCAVTLEALTDVIVALVLRVREPKLPQVHVEFSPRLLVWLVGASLFRTLVCCVDDLFAFGVPFPVLHWSGSVPHLHFYIAWTDLNA